MTIKIIFIIWRYYKMSRNVMGVVKGVGAGIAAGVVVGFVGSQMMKNEKQMKKNYLFISTFSAFCPSVGWFFLVFYGMDGCLFVQCLM